MEQAKIHFKPSVKINYFASHWLYYSALGLEIHIPCPFCICVTLLRKTSAFWEVQQRIYFVSSQYLCYSASLPLVCVSFRVIVKLNYVPPSPPSPLPSLHHFRINIIIRDSHQNLLHTSVAVVVEALSIFSDGHRLNTEPIRSFSAHRIVICYSSRINNRLIVKIAHNCNTYKRYVKQWMTVRSGAWWWTAIYLDDAI